MKKQYGFTLIELMVVAAIIAILMAVALPSYERYIIKGNQGTAKAFLLQIATREAQYLADNRGAYANANGTSEVTSALGITPPTDVSGMYTFSIVTFSKGSGSIAPPGFRAVAAPVDGISAAGTNCFSITDDGLKRKGEGTACADGSAADNW